MKTSQWIIRLAACAAVTAGVPAFADVGLMDGQDPYGKAQSTRSRAEVRSELDAARSQGVLSHGDTDTSPMMKSSSPAGARGVAGSRYSERTRDEVRAELDEFNRMNRDNPRSDIYRPN